MLPLYSGKGGHLELAAEAEDQLANTQNLTANQMLIADQNLSLKMMSSSGQTMASQAT